MEQWLTTHWFNVGSTAVFLVSVVVHYTKTSAHIETLEQHIAVLEETLRELSIELKRVKEEGLPHMCRFHEERITSLENRMQTSLIKIQEDIATLKQMSESNRDLINRERDR